MKIEFSWPATTNFPQIQILPSEEQIPVGRDFEESSKLQA